MYYLISSVGEYVNNISSVGEGDIYVNNILSVDEGDIYVNNILSEGDIYVNNIYEARHYLKITLSPSLPYITPFFIIYVN